MLKQKRSKVSRMRGSNSHGWGHKKKHRGSGHRGGVGLAGTGRGADAKKPTILTTFGSSYFGKKGFKSISKESLNLISLKYIEDHFEKLVEEGKIIKEKSDFVMDTNALGYDKVLGTGKLTKKLKVVCREISESAKEKIEAVGGKVELVFDESFESSEKAEA